MSEIISLKNVGGLPQNVSCYMFSNSKSIPLVIAAQEPNLNLTIWYQDNQASVKALLLEFGAVLFRGFDIKKVEDFELCMEAMIPHKASYVEGATPRTKLSKAVYTSTEFPPEEEIALHNELSYVVTPPSVVSFCCLVPAAKGGQTQIADVNQVYKLLPRELVEEFREKGGWKLQRNFGLGLGPTVQKAFGTTITSEIQTYCDAANISLDIADGEHIRISQVREAIHSHPVSGKSLWFNHISFWHPSSLPPLYREEMSMAFGVEDFPFVTYFGNGEEIADEKVRRIAKAYKAAEVVFDWQSSDVMLLDNWRVAHGRKPFEGERKILVAMGHQY